MRGIIWLAGLLEGEGCFTDTKSGVSGHYRTPLLSLVLTDKDVLEAAALLIKRLGRRAPTRYRRMLPSGKTAYQCQTTGLPAMMVMMGVLPYMGRRRSAAIRRVFKNWRPKKYKAAIEYRRHVRLSSTPRTSIKSSR